MSRPTMTDSDRVLAVVQALGGHAPRAEVFRRIAPRLGIRGAQTGMGLALLRGVIRLDEQDTVHAVEGAA